MRRLLLLPLVCLFVTSYSQMITTDPAMPTPGRVIKIYYDSSKDAGELHNHTGDIYAHTGVNLKGKTGWQNVIGTWGSNTTQPKLTYLGNYRYEMVISPDLKTYYSLSATDIVTKICLVLRNAGGNLQTRPDIFIDVFEAKLNAAFALPEKNSVVVDLNDRIPVKATAMIADSVSLYINGSFIKSGETPDLVTDTLTALQYGEFWVKAIAWDLPEFAADSFFFYVRKAVVIEETGPGMKDGINYTGDNSVTLVLHAPYKNYAFVTGDFNGWLARESGYMKRTADGERYWITIDGLEAGKEYRFQYLIDSSLYIADPYSTKILDEWNDGYITSDTYPGLIPFPKDTASGIVSVLQTAKIPYSWQSSEFNPPAKKDLVIYELLIRDFIARHDFKTLTDTIGYLADLGINAIELMPVSEFEGNLSWGYNPSFYFAPDKYYGPENDMKAFIDTCHSLGIAVIMDIVLNHCMGQSPFVQLYLDYYGSDQIYMKPQNPWFNTSSPNPVYKWGADFNHESYRTKKLVDSVTSFWLTEYRIDGFRFDFTKGFTNTPGDGSSYDASRIAILKRMADHIWKINPQAYVILEHFAPISEETELANHGMMVWGNMNYQYAEAAMGYASDLSGAAYLSRRWTVPHLVTYMESHDEERLMYKAITYGNSIPEYNIRNTVLALKRMELDALFFLTIPGPKMIWQFGELGYDISINENGRTGEKPIRWDYLNDSYRNRLYRVYKLLINLRKTEPVFGTSDYTYSLNSYSKRLQLNDDEMKVNILGNFGVTSTNLFPAFQQAGKWYEYFTGDSITVSDVNTQLLFRPGEYRLYTTKKMTSPKLILGTEDIIVPDRNDQVIAYPNPSDGEFSFIFENDIRPPLTVTVCDLTGRIVRQIRSFASGSDIISWDGRANNGSDLPPGIYIVHFKSPGSSSTVKVVRK